MTDLPLLARCPGPAARDIILADGWAVPDALVAERYEAMGDADIPYDRYVSTAFFDREMERLWPRTWQWACREEHIPEPGDWITYDVGRHSILIVRGEDGDVRAFPNACLHRGTQLKRSGQSGAASELRCPFHGWSWTLEGGLKNVPCRWDFPHVTDEAFALPRVKVELWGGFVFVNMDPDAAPLADSRHAWLRLAATLGLMTLGSSVMYVVSVVLPAVQVEFGVARADASLPYTLLMVGFGLGGLLMGRLSDRHGARRVRFHALRAQHLGGGQLFVDGRHETDARLGEPGTGLPYRLVHHAQW